MKNFTNPYFSYWTGLSQSDGSLKKHSCLKNNKSYEQITLEFEVKDKILVEKFQKITNSVFSRNLKIFQRAKGTWTCHIGAKKLLPIFDKLDIDLKDLPNPPR